MTSEATIRVRPATRDALNVIARERRLTADETLLFLLDEHRKARWAEQADRFYEDHPQALADDMAEAAAWDVTVADGLADEGPYRWGPDGPPDRALAA